MWHMTEFASFEFACMADGLGPVPRGFVLRMSESAWNRTETICHTSRFETCESSRMPYGPSMPYGLLRARGEGALQVQKMYRGYRARCKARGRRALLQDQIEEREKLWRENPTFGEASLLEREKERSYVYEEWPLPYRRPSSTAVSEARLYGRR